jgi:SAM-dependent methyltransferase
MPATDEFSSAGSTAKTMSEPIAPEIRKAHDRIAPSYGITDLHGTIPEPSFQHWNLDRRGLRHLKYFRDRYLGSSCRLLLDAGCGNGQFTQVYAAWDIPLIIGLDFSLPMLTTARQRARMNGYEARLLLIQVELSDLSCLRDASVDGAHLFGVIEHLDNPGQVLAELARVLKSGGHLLFSVPRRWSVPFFDYCCFGQSPVRWGRPQGLRDALAIKEKLRFYRFYGGKEVKELITGLTGTELIERRPYSFFHVQGRQFAPLHWLARHRFGYRVLDCLDSLFRRIWPWPGAEYVIIKKN